VGFCLLSAIGCLLFVVSTVDSMVGASLLIMSFALLGTWGALYAYTPELYPTGVRATGMGAAGAIARLGGLVAPSLMAFVASEGLGLAIGLFAGLLVIAAIAAVAIDSETRQASIA
jgi:putative MFS transporter